jgi:hypothetical protein
LDISAGILLAESLEVMLVVSAYDRRSQGERLEEVAGRFLR